MDFDKICKAVSMVFSAMFVFAICWLTGAMKWMTGGTLQMVAVIVAIILIWLILTAVIGVLLVKFLRKKYIKENGEILEKFSDKKDAEKLYKALITMKNPPRFQDDKAMLHLNISTALYFQGKIEESLSEIEKVKTGNKQIAEIAEKQKAEIIAKITSN